MKTTIAIKPASFGSVSTSTLKTEHLLSAFISELEWQLQRNGEFFSQPENFTLRDKLNAIVGEAQDCFAENGETIDPDKEDIASELVNETFPDTFSEYFAPAYSYFGAHCGDGADFGYWPIDIEEIKEQVEFCSSRSQEYPDDDFTGEWLHINERGNCTLYVRDETGKDVEIWGLV